MNYYDVNDHLTSVAQSCKHLSSGKSINAISTAGENVSCRICKNWNGNRCIINAYESMVSMLDLD